MMQDEIAICQEALFVSFHAVPRRDRHFPAPCALQDHLRR